MTGTTDNPLMGTATAILAHMLDRHPADAKSLGASWCTGPLANAEIWAQTGWVRVTVTEIAPDGRLRRGMVDTADRDDASRWEELAERAALGLPPPYRPAPGRPVFEIRVDGQAVLVAAADVIGPLGELVTAVLAEGDAE